LGWTGVSDPGLSWAGCVCLYWLEQTSVQLSRRRETRFGHSSLSHWCVRHCELPHRGFKRASFRVFTHQQLRRQRGHPTMTTIRLGAVNCRLPLVRRCPASHPAPRPVAHAGASSGVRHCATWPSACLRPWTGRACSARQPEWATSRRRRWRWRRHWAGGLAAGGSGSGARRAKSPTPSSATPAVVGASPRQRQAAPRLVTAG